MEKESKTGTDKRNEKVYKGAIIALVLILGVITVLWITTRQDLNEMTRQKETTAAINTELQEELDGLLTEYNMVKLEYDSILETQDSIILAKATEIEQLIRRQADYYRIRRDLNNLREITQTYVHEIDSLYTVNEVLRTENVQMREEIQVVQQRSMELAEDREELSEKVDLAAGLRAYQIQADAIRIRGRGREAETDRASRAEQIKVQFNIGANPIAQSGDHNVYLRVAGPDNAILRLSDEDVYSFVHNADTLQYSSKQTMDYQNQDMQMTIYWHRTEEFQPGLYLISLYTDEVKLGETTLTLE
ncbi:MAG: hypothetical protein R6U64_06245 [Bacteroidales bacterium]